MIQDAELGWFLREKLGLDPLRRHLLDTALQGDESYARIESEILRLRTSTSQILCFVKLLKMVSSLS